MNKYQRAVAIFIAVNIALMLLVPPFLHYPLQLVHLGAILIAINVMVVWLLFSTARRAEIATTEKLLKLAKALMVKELQDSAKAMRSQPVVPNPTPVDLHLGAGPDRRRRWDPRFRGSERRERGDRRHKPRAN